MLKIELIEILEELSSIGGNHDIARLIEVRHKFLDFLKQDDQLLAPLNNENFIIAKDAVHFIDAQLEYVLTSDRDEASKHIKYFLDRMISAQKWNIYELKFLIGSVTFIECIKQALELAYKSLEMIGNFKIAHRSDTFTGFLAFNMSSRLLHAKFFEDYSGIDLEYEFDQWLFKLERIAATNHEMKAYFDVGQIRQAIFNLNSKLIDQLFQKFERTCEYNEKFVKLIGREVDFYIASKEYGQIYSMLLKKLYKGGEDS